MEKDLETYQGERAFPIFFGMAYQGFASGDPERDAKAIRIFLGDGHLLGISQSLAKNIGLYVCCVKMKNKRWLSKVGYNRLQGQCNPPVHGSLLVSIILIDPELKKLWLSEVKDK